MIIFQHTRLVDVLFYWSLFYCSLHFIFSNWGEKGEEGLAGIRKKLPTEKIATENIATENIATKADMKVTE